MGKVHPLESRSELEKSKTRVVEFFPAQDMAMKRPDRTKWKTSQSWYSKPTQVGAEEALKKSLSAPEASQVTCCFTSLIMIIRDTHGGFHNFLNGGIQKWLAYNGKPIKWMLWGYPHFRKPPHYMRMIVTFQETNTFQETTTL